MDHDKHSAWKNSHNSITSNFSRSFIVFPTFNEALIRIIVTDFRVTAAKRQWPSRDRNALFDVVKSWPRFRRTFCVTRIQWDEKRCALGLWLTKQNRSVVRLRSNRWLARLNPSECLSHHRQSDIEHKVKFVTIANNM